MHRLRTHTHTHTYTHAAILIRAVTFVAAHIRIREKFRFRTLRTWSGPFHSREAISRWTLSCCCNAANSRRNKFSHHRCVAPLRSLARESVVMEKTRSLVQVTFLSLFFFICHLALFSLSLSFVQYWNSLNNMQRYLEKIRNTGRRLRRHF